MDEQRSLASGGMGAGEARSAIAAMLKNSFTENTGSDGPVDNMEAAMGGSRTPTRSAVYSTVRTPSRSPSKARSLSDSTPKLSPSPKIKEQSRVSKDDNTLPSSTNPKTPRRPDFLARGLSLQMPPRDHLGILSPANLTSRAPLSPQIDKKHTYGSPAKVLPRHSRGLDFSRACTNLHHSTLAEQSSPDSSPTITQKGMMIPHRKMSINAMALDPPQIAPWSQMGTSEKSVISSSLGSVNMLGSDSPSSSDDDIEPMEPDESEDAILTTPQVLKRSNPTASTPFGTGGWPGAGSPGISSFTNFHRARLRNGRSRKSSSSASGHSSLASPVPASPPANKNDNTGYFGREVTMKVPPSRRESLSMHTHDLHISSGNDSGDEAGMPAPSTPAPGVIRRAVTRRGNLLPKIRAFGRVRDELFEESMPVDAEVKREAEVIRQVREGDPSELTRLDSTTTQSSPTLQAVNSLADVLQGIPDDTTRLDNNSLTGSSSGKGLFGAFSKQSSSGNGGKEFWNTFENRHRTPPPPSFLPRASSSTVSDDVNMDSPIISTPSNSVYPWALPSQEQNIAPPDTSRASTPQAQPQPTAGVTGPISAADGLRKVNKRRRDDDLDLQSIKRRAVSPGVSVGNSPILSQSPSQRSENLWGQTSKVTPGREGSVNGGHAVGERSNSNGSVAQTPLLGPKRIGLQGINDMQGMAEKMSIE